MEISNILEARIELLHAQNGAVAYSVALLDQQNYITHIITNANISEVSISNQASMNISAFPQKPSQEIPWNHCLGSSGAGCGCLNHFAGKL